MISTLHLLSPFLGECNRKMCPQRHVHGQGLQPWGHPPGRLYCLSTPAHPSKLGHPPAPGPVCMVALGRGLTGYPNITLLLHMSTPGQGVPAAQDSHLTQPAPSGLGVTRCPFWDPLSLPIHKAALNCLTALLSPIGHCGAGWKLGCSQAGTRVVSKPCSSVSALAAASPREATGEMTSTEALSLQSLVQSPQNPPLPCR